MLDPRLILPNYGTTAPAGDPTTCPSDWPTRLALMAATAGAAYVVARLAVESVEGNALLYGYDAGHDGKSWDATNRAFSLNGWK